MGQSDVMPVAEPLYEKVYRIFRSRILGGQWKPRSLLPGEVLLSHELGVSVGTVRKAMDQLARDNLVIRERGRGTFVRGDEEWQDAKGLKLFDGSGRLIAPSIELVDAHLGAATECEARSLRIELVAGGPQVLRLSRHWRSGSMIVNREIIVIEASRFRRVAALVGRSRVELHEVYTEAVLDRIERTVWSIGARAGDVRLESDAYAAPVPAPDEIPMKVGVLDMGSLSLDARGLPLEIGRHEIQLGNCVLQLNG